MIPPSRDECIEVARKLWGPENHALSTSHEMRWGTKGSRKLNLDDLLWHDFEKDEGGGWSQMYKAAGIPLPRDDDHQPQATYDYRDETGRLLYQVVRLPRHRFYQRHPNGVGAWVNNLQGVRRVLYRLPELVTVDRDELVFVTEGEKDADTVIKLGLTATTNAGGAGKWLVEYNEVLRGRQVVLLPDNDDVGKRHMREVARGLKDGAASIVILDLPGLGPKEDVSDWVDRGGTREQLYELAITAPLPQPEPEPELTSGEFTLRFGADVLATIKSAVIVPGILYRRSVSLIYGPPKSGKSFLATDLALAITSNCDRWMGLPIRTHGPVLYCACEGHAGYWKRLRAAQQHYGWTNETFPASFILAIGRPALIVSDDRGRTFTPAPEAVLNALQTARRRNMPPVGVIIDTVFRSFGAGNVNYSDHMNAYLATLSEIADQDIAVAAVHHEIKSGGTPAGSVSAMAGSDAIVHVMREEDGSRWWEIEFAKDDAETERIPFELKVIDLGLDELGEPLSSCVVIGPEEVRRPTNRPVRPRLPSAVIGLQALENALARYSQPLPSTPDYPANISGVPIETWRTEFYAIKGGTPDNNRQSFNRAQEHLQAKSVIAQRNGLVWIVPRRDTA